MCLGLSRHAEEAKEVGAITFETDPVANSPPAVTSTAGSGDRVVIGDINKKRGDAALASFRDVFGCQ